MWKVGRLKFRNSPNHEWQPGEVYTGSDCENLCRLGLIVWEENEKVELKESVKEDIPNDGLKDEPSLKKQKKPKKG